MVELPQPKGVFSGNDLPQDWRSNDLNPEASLHFLNFMFPEMKVVSQVSRGFNNLTFVLDSPQGLRICQIGPPTVDVEHSVFENASERMDYLSKNGIPVPKIISGGSAVINDQQREFLLMQYSKGLGAEKFLAKHPEKSSEFYEKLGELLANLQMVPVDEENEPADDKLISNVEKKKALLIEKGVFTSAEIDPLPTGLRNRLSEFGISNSSFVHLDPFPVNIQVVGGIRDFKLSLIDIEAINLGHPLMEGLGRAIGWGILDWNYITGNKLINPQILIDSLLKGYSRMIPKIGVFLEDPDALRRLLDSAQLTSLPGSILKESQKPKPAEYYEWSKARLLELISQSG